MGWRLGCGEAKEDGKEQNRSGLMRDFLFACLLQAAVPVRADALFGGSRSQGSDRLENEH